MSALAKAWSVLSTPPQSISEFGKRCIAVQSTAKRGVSTPPRFKRSSWAIVNGFCGTAPQKFEGTAAPAGAAKAAEVSRTVVSARSAAEAAVARFLKFLTGASTLLTLPGCGQFEDRKG